VIVIEFTDGMHEYVTTPVRRVLKIVGKDTFYIETANSRYRLDVRGKVQQLEGASSGLGPPIPRPRSQSPFAAPNARKNRTSRRERRARDDRPRPFSC
jgi:hypothetical protein